MAYQDRLIFKIGIVILVSITFFGCSKQSDSIIDLVVPPSVTFDKTEVKIRVNDTYNTNNNSGYVTIQPVNGTDKVAYTKVVDSSGKIKVILYGMNVTNQPFELSTPKKVFINGDDTGKYVLNFFTYDRFGKYSKTPFIVNVVSVIPPTAILQYSVTNNTIKMDASKSYSINGKIISYAYYIDGLSYTIANNNYTKTLNPGDHEIGLIVYDDLGTASLYVKENIKL